MYERFLCTKSSDIPDIFVACLRCIQKKFDKPKIKPGIELFFCFLSTTSFMLPPFQIFVGLDDLWCAEEAGICQVQSESGAVINGTN